MQHGRVSGNIKFLFSKEVPYRIIKFDFKLHFYSSILY